MGIICFADADKRRKNKCKKTLTWFFAKLCTAAPVTVEEKKNHNGRLMKSILIINTYFKLTLINHLYYAGQKIMITILIMNVIFWVVNFKTQNYYVISTTQNVYLRLSMYDCSNFGHSCRIFGISELQTV
jgi:hypothetical protein